MTPSGHDGLPICQGGRASFSVNFVADDVALQDFLDEFQCFSLVSRHRNVGLKDFASVVNRSPQAPHLTIDFHEHRSRPPEWWKFARGTMSI
jgi:hypothetical protein